MTQGGLSGGNYEGGTDFKGLQIVEPKAVLPCHPTFIFNLTLRICKLGNNSIWCYMSYMVGNAIISTRDVFVFIFLLKI